MCVIFFSFKIHPTYDLILLSNRDEYFERTTDYAKFWYDSPDLLGGRDQEAGGTWLGVSKQGRLAALTNFRDPSSYQSNAASRGKLVTDYLLGSVDSEIFLADLEKKSSSYNGFNLLVGNRSDIFYYSNRRKGLKKLLPGLYGLSNHLLNTPWPKVVRGNKIMNKMVKDKNFSKEDAFLMLRDTSRPADEALPESGVGIEWERILSPLFVVSPSYGTRCSTILLIDKKGKISFMERSYDSKQNIISDVTYEFSVD